MTETTPARPPRLTARESFKAWTHDKLRFAEARRHFELAVERDSEFALAQYYLALNATTPQAFFDRLNRAVALASHASEGERLVILALQAGANADPEKQQLRDFTWHLLRAGPHQWPVDSAKIDKLSNLLSPAPTMLQLGRARLLPSLGASARREPRPPGHSRLPIGSLRAGQRAMRCRRIGPTPSWWRGSVPLMVDG